MGIKRKASPDDFEDRDEFMEHCVAESGDEDACALAWEERKAEKVVTKTHVSEGHGLSFILSDATPDRMGDVIEATGWDLVNFKRNPVALFNHNPNFPIAKAASCAASCASRPRARPRAMTKFAGWSKPTSCAQFRWVSCRSNRSR